MKIILRHTIDKVGKQGEVVDVREGYARNFLIPQALAVEARGGSMKQLDHVRRQIAKREEKLNRIVQDLADKIQDISCTITVKAGEEDRLFGSVTNGQIADSLKAHGIEVNKRQILLEEPIKSLGVYLVPIDLTPGVKAKLKVWVVRDTQG